MTRSALVTGAAGFIGSHVVERLLADGWEVTGLDDFNDFYAPELKWRNIAACLQHPRFTLVVADIRDTDGLTTSLRGSFDVIVHLAARAGVRPSIADPVLYQATNVAGTQNVLEFARMRRVPQVVFASSSSVYGINPRVPWSESDPVLLPISPYASTKISGELLGHVYSHLFGIRFIALRFFTVYGPRQRPDLAIRKFAEAIRAGRPIPVFGDGSTSRDYTYVDDVVNGVMGALRYDRSPFEVVNLGNSHAVALGDLVQLLERLIGRAAVVHRLPAQPGDVPRTWSNIEKANRLLGYEPVTPLAVGLERTVSWLSGTPTPPRRGRLAHVTHRGGPGVTRRWRASAAAPAAGRSLRMSRKWMASSQGLTVEKTESLNISNETARPGVVLVTTDMEWSARSLETLLNPQGYVVVRAPAEAQVVSLAITTQPDAIILEHRPQGLEAVEVLQALRDHPRLSSCIPVIVTSASPIDRAQRLAVYGAGAWDHFTHPIDTEVLLRQLRTFISVKRHIDRLQQAAMVDGATGLATPHALAQRTREISAAAMRRREPIACVAALLELEPPVGAEPQAAAAIAGAARQFGAAWKANARATDAVGHLGPAEFGIVAASTDSSGAEALLRRLRDSLASQRVAVEGLPRRIRLRTEVASVEDYGAATTDALELLRRASRTLHAARAGEHADRTPT